MSPPCSSWCTFLHSDRKKSCLYYVYVLEIQPHTIHLSSLILTEYIRIYEANDHRKIRECFNHLLALNEWNIQVEILYWYKLCNLLRAKWSMETKITNGLRVWNLKSQAVFTPDKVTTDKMVDGVLGISFQTWMKASVSSWTSAIWWLQIHWHIPKVLSSI